MRNFVTSAGGKFAVADWPGASVAVTEESARFVFACRRGGVRLAGRPDQQGAGDESDDGVVPEHDLLANRIRGASLVDRRASR